MGWRVLGVVVMRNGQVNLFCKTMAVLVMAFLLALNWLSISDTNEPFLTKAHR